MWTLLPINFFVEWSDFTMYFPLAKLDEGQPANKGGQFHIIGHGAVMKMIILGSLRMTITFKNTIHTPNLIANLVSISMLDAAGCWTLFGGGESNSMISSMEIRDS